MVPLQLDSTGRVKYDLIARMGQRKDKVVHTSLQAMMRQERSSDELVKPDEEEIAEVFILNNTLLFGSYFSWGHVLINNKL